jgi:hypothetical protein
VFKIVNIDNDDTLYFTGLYSFKAVGLSWASMVHIYNPSYTWDSDQEDHSSSQPSQIVCETLSRKNPSQKRAGGVTQGVGSEFKAQHHKINK